MYQKTDAYARWHTNSVQIVNKEYHIVQSGILNKKDYSLLFENTEEKHHIPVEATEQLDLYNEVCCTIEFNSSFGEQHWILESGLYMQLIEDIIV